MTKKSSRNRRGQSIIEAIVAISVLVVGLMGIVSLTIRALSEERTVADNFRASYLATEGAELARNIMDGNYLQTRPWNCVVSGGSCIAFGTYALDYASTDFSKACNLANSGSQLYFTLSTGRYAYSGSVVTPFRRCITLTAVNAKEIRVTSAVAWTSRGMSNTVTVEDHFFDWRPE